jgi:hypothetical protein
MRLVEFSNGVMVNLEKVSSVKFLDNRIVLNMNYCIVKQNNVIPDYVYIDNYTEEDENTLRNYERFIVVSKHILLNRECISNVKKVNDEVIINLTHPHTYNLVKNNKGVRSVIAEYIRADLSILGRL